jgi:cytochrome P450 family 2 subfamily C/cytochrome P450 family 2 subfamily G
MDLFVAGLDSTANTLDWMFIYLISYPDVYARVMAESETVIGRERLPGILDRAKLVLRLTFERNQGRNRW